MIIRIKMTITLMMPILTLPSDELPIMLATMLMTRALNGSFKWILFMKWTTGMIVYRRTFEMTLRRPTGLTIRMTVTILILFCPGEDDTNVEDDVRHSGAEVRRTAPAGDPSKGEGALYTARLRYSLNLRRSRVCQGRPVASHGLSYTDPDGGFG